MVVSETQTFSVSADEDLIEQIEAVSNNRSQAVREALQLYLKNTSSKEQRLDQIEDEIEELEEKQEQLQTQKRGLEAERAQIEKELEKEAEKRDKYEDLVDELAERKANGYPVLESSKFDRAIGLSEWTGDLAVEKVLDEIESKAGVEEDETVVEESAEDYDFDVEDINGE